MRILVVASFNRGRFAPFIVEQAAALKKQGCEIEWLGLRGKGLKGYLKNYPSLKQTIKAFHPDIIHAHYGLSGLLANCHDRLSFTRLACSLPERLSSMTPILPPIENTDRSRGEE